MKKLLIKVDTNDADYVTRITNVTDKELEELVPVFKAIKNFKPYVGTLADWKYPHNFPEGQCLREDLGEKSVEEIYSKLTPKQLELFRDRCPYPEYGFHTVKNIEVFEVTKEKKYL